MARHKVKRFAAGDPVVDNSAPTPDDAMQAGNVGLGEAYMNTGPTPGAPTDIGPQAPIQQNPMPMPAPAPSRVVVSKKQLAESGYDNLRDYLNAQKGLTRKGESEARKPSKAPAKATAKEVVKEVKQSEWDDNSPLPTMKKSGRELLMESKPSSEKTQKMLEAMVPGGGALKMVANAARNLAARRGAMEAAKDMAPALRQLESNGRRVVGPAQTELANPQLKLGMKKGGKVKHKAAPVVHKAKGGRGDGIATKGYTKGRYL